VKVSYAKALEASELKIYSKAEKWFKVAKDCPLATTEKKKQLNVRIKECKKLIQKSQESMVERNTLLSEVIPEFEMGYIEGKIFQMGKESTVL